MKPFLSLPKSSAKTPLPTLVHEPASQIKEAAGKDSETGFHTDKHEQLTSDTATRELLNATTKTPAPSAKISVPTNEIPAPSNAITKTPAPSDKISVPSNETPAPSNETPAPSNTITMTPAPSDKISVPSNETPAPSNETPAPSNTITMTPAPSNKISVPSNETPAPSNETPAPSNETTAQSTVKNTPCSPELSPGPNLYPCVHVTANPISGVDNGEITGSKPNTAAGSHPVSAPPASICNTTTADGEALQTLQQAQTPRSPPPPLPQKPVTPSGERSAEPPSTPTRAEHPSPTVPLIQEPPCFPPYNPNPRPAPDTLSYLESASMMSGTLESLSGLGDDGSSIGSDSEVNGMAIRRTDKYGFLGGSQYSDSSDKDVRVEVARQREIKWLDMFCHWDKWIKHRFEKVKLRCRKGIPSSLRARAWQLLSNSKELLDANPGKFEELEREPGEAKWLDIIEKDLHRQFPFHEMFAARGGHGQQDLFRILKAYTVYRPDEGYCQAQAPVAAVLLMHMPAEHAFWCLVQICEKYLPGYYSAGLEAIQLDGEIFFSLLRRTCPMAYRHLKKFKIDPILYMTEWFMCIFSRTLPWACVLRVWDMFFCEGVKIVFRVGLVLLKQMLGSVDKLRELQGMYETMERLRSISPDTVREDVLVHEIISLPVTEALIERECNVQVRKWRESRGELTHQPGRRLHGTRAIYECKRRAAAISSGGSFSFLGSSAPPPGPLRASSSLLSLPGFRRSRGTFQYQAKKSSFSGPSGKDALPPLSPPAGVSVTGRSPSQKPPIPPGTGLKAVSPHVQSPLAGIEAAPSCEATPASEGASEQGQPGALAPPQSTPTPPPPPSVLSPSPKIVSEQITLTIPSPTANNMPLPPYPDEKKKEAEPAAVAAPAEEEGKKKKKSKEDKKKEKEDEKKKLKEKKEKEKAEKERLRKEKERQEKEKKKGGKKKDKGGGATEDKSGAAAPRDSA